MAKTKRYAGSFVVKTCFSLTIWASVSFVAQAEQSSVEAVPPESVKSHSVTETGSSCEAKKPDVFNSDQKKTPIFKNRRHVFYKNGQSDFKLSLESITHPAVYGAGCYNYSVSGLPDSLKYDFKTATIEGRWPTFADNSERYLVSVSAWDRREGVYSTIVIQLRNARPAPPSRPPSNRSKAKVPGVYVAEEIPPVEPPKLLSAFSDITIGPDEDVSINVAVHFNSDDFPLPLIYTVTGLPDGISFRPEDSTISGKLAVKPETSPARIEIIADNGLGSEISTHFEITFTE